MYLCYIGIGSNLGQREDQLSEARVRIEEAIGPVLRQSTVIETEPWGVSDQPSYLNQVIEVNTKLAPTEVMKSLLNIEAEMGRVRTRQWEPRMIDLDLLLFEDRIINEETLQVPHPRMHERLFVLEPLVELNEELIHPVLNLRIRMILEQLQNA